MINKKLGQHFLKSNKILTIISQSINIQDDDTIIEIGPGHGELTSNILQAKKSIKKLILIEKDKNLANILKKKFNQKNIQIINDDVLKILPLITTNLENYKIVGNIPYYLTGRLLRIFSELKNKPKLIILLVQKEVALRLSANQPKMNLLAASVQFWADVRILNFVPKTCFYPQPKIDSSLIQLTPHNNLLTDPNLYYNFIKKLFKQPRKTIENNLKMFYINIKGVLTNYNIPLNARPQDLNISTIIKLQKILYNNKNEKK
ncbi:MAG: 16S rRNA (adenine(1518)-N(6)/adenine(1519)-N(6))-dimethyltransferase RsmA [Minisyncoccia bacterium]